MGTWTIPKTCWSPRKTQKETITVRNVVLWHSRWQLLVGLFHIFSAVQFTNRNDQKLKMQNERMQHLHPIWHKLRSPYFNSTEPWIHVFMYASSQQGGSQQQLEELTMPNPWWFSKNPYNFVLLNSTVADVWPCWWKERKHSFLIVSVVSSHYIHAGCDWISVVL